MMLITKISEVNSSAFIFSLFHEDFCVYSIYFSDFCYLMYNLESWAVRMCIFFAKAKFVISQSKKVYDTAKSLHIKDNGIHPEY